MNERIGARPWLAYTKEDYGRMLRERGDVGDQQRAEELLVSAVETYRECEMNAHAATAMRATHETGSA